MKKEETETTETTETVHLDKQGDEHVIVALARSTAVAMANEMLRDQCDYIASESTPVPGVVFEMTMRIRKS